MFLHFRMNEGKKFLKAYIRKSVFEKVTCLAFFETPYTIDSTSKNVDLP
jgi:hypothetical protein